jgi:hypothetical protein
MKTTREDRELCAAPARPTYRIRDWTSLYENNRTRELKRLDWVPVPNRMDGDGYTELLDHPAGVSHLGAWLALVQIASRCDPRGTLMRDRGKAHDFRSLSRISRIPAETFEEAIPRFLDIGWLEELTVREFKNMQGGAGKSQDDAVLCDQTASCGDKEGNGREGKEGNEMVIRSTPAWQQDAEFVAFRDRYMETGGSFIDRDFAEAYEFRWRKFDFEQKAARLAALGLHAEEYRSNPRFVPKPQKFLESEWERPVRPAATTAKPAPSLADRTIALMQKRIDQGRPPL